MDKEELEILDAICKSAETVKLDLPPEAMNETKSIKEFAEQKGKLYFSEIDQLLVRQIGDKEFSSFKVPGELTEQKKEPETPVLSVQKDEGPEPSEPPKSPMREAEESKMNAIVARLETLEISQKKYRDWADQMWVHSSKLQERVKELERKRG